MSLTLSDRNFHEAVGSNSLMLIDFYGAWCRPCHLLTPILERVADQYPDVVIAKVNVDENQEVTSEHSISLLPTMLFFRNGEMVLRLTGLHSEAALKKNIESVLLG